MWSLPCYSLVESVQFRGVVLSRSRIRLRITICTLAKRERERRIDRDLLQTEPGTEVMLKQGTKHCTIQNMFITRKLKHRNNEHILSDRNHNKQANKRGIHIQTRTCLQHYSLLQTLAVHELIRLSQSFYSGHDDHKHLN